MFRSMLLFSIHRDLCLFYDQHSINWYMFTVMLICSLLQYIIETLIFFFHMFDYILLKEKIHLEDIETVNISASKTRTIKFIKGTLLQLKSYIDSQVLMVVDFNNPLFAIAWSSMPKTKQRNVGYNGCYKPIVPSS